MSQSNNKSTCWFLLLIFFAEIAVCLFFVSSKWAQENTVQEGRWIQRDFGSDTAKTIQSRADWLYQKFIIGPDIEGGFYRLFIPNREQREKSTGLEDLGYREGFFSWVEQCFQSCLDTTYWFFRRLALLSIWLWIWIPALVVAGRVGWLERKIKISTYGYTSPVVHSLAWQATKLTLVFMFLSFIVPIALPPVLIPIGLGVLTIMTWVNLGNIQKRIWKNLQLIPAIPTLNEE